MSNDDLQNILNQLNGFEGTALIAKVRFRNSNVEKAKITFDIPFLGVEIGEKVDIFDFYLIKNSFQKYAAIVEVRGENDLHIYTDPPDRL